MDGKGDKDKRVAQVSFIEAAWFHINWCPNGRLAKLFENAYRRKRDKKKAINCGEEARQHCLGGLDPREEVKMIPDKA